MEDVMKCVYFDKPTLLPAFSSRQFAIATKSRRKQEKGISEEAKQADLEKRQSKKKADPNEVVRRTTIPSLKMLGDVPR